MGWNANDLHRFSDLPRRFLLKSEYKASPTFCIRDRGAFRDTSYFTGWQPETTVRIANILQNFLSRNQVKNPGYLRKFRRRARADMFPIVFRCRQIRGSSVQDSILRIYAPGPGCYRVDGRCCPRTGIAADLTMTSPYPIDAKVEELLSV